MNFRIQTIDEQIFPIPNLVGPQMALFGQNILFLHRLLVTGCVM